jgi:hypothetical protein
VSGDALVLAWSSFEVILSGFVTPRQGLVFMNRLQFGFYSVLARLDVAADFAAVERRFLSEAGL